MGVMPKALGDPYFISCRVGAEEAAKQFNIDLIWDGPTGVDAAKQSEVIQGWITRRVDAIALSVANGPAISSVLRKARAQGIKVVTWDADADADARDYFVDQATPQGIGDTLTDQTAQVLNDDGEFAIITGALTAANQNLWIQYVRERVAAKYPKLKLAAIRPSDDDRDKAFSETQTLLNVYPKIRCIMAISAPAVPGAAEAVKQSGRTGCACGWTLIAQPMQALRARRHYFGGGALENERPGLPGRRCCRSAGTRHLSGRRPQV